MSDNILELVDGEPGLWDKNWASLDASMVQLYTRGAPKTIHQFWQRCYFEDIWTCMGVDAAESRYLELGAGRGTTSMYLASRGCAVTMLDLSGRGFAVARTNFTREGLPTPTLVLADARHTNLPDASYHCVFSIGLLEHFTNPKPVLAESVRLLRPGGLQFAVIIPNRPASVRHLALALFRPWQLARELAPEHLRTAFRRSRARTPPVANGGVFRADHTREDYVRMLDGLNVVDVRCVPYNPYHPVFRRPSLEANIAIPLYSSHRTVKRIFGGNLMATAAAFASCDLLTFRKGPAPS